MLSRLCCCYSCWFVVVVEGFWRGGGCLGEGCCLFLLFVCSCVFILERGGVFVCFLDGGLLAHCSFILLI